MALLPSKFLITPRQTNGKAPTYACIRCGHVYVKSGMGSAKHHGPVCMACLDREWIKQQRACSRRSNGNDEIARTHEMTRGTKVRSGRWPSRGPEFIRVQQCKLCGAQRHLTADGGQEIYRSAEFDRACPAHVMWANPLTGVEAHAELMHGKANLRDARQTTSPARAGWSAGKAGARAAVVTQYGPVQFRDSAGLLRSDAKAVARSADRVARGGTPTPVRGNSRRSNFLPLLPAAVSGIVGGAAWEGTKRVTGVTRKNGFVAGVLGGVLGSAVGAVAIRKFTAVKPNPLPKSCLIGTRRANSPAAFIFAIGNGSRKPVRPVSQRRANDGGYQIKLPRERVLGVMPLAEARRRWPDTDVQVAAFRDFNRGAEPHGEVILWDDGQRGVRVDYVAARSPEVVYGGIAGSPPGSFKNSGGVIGGDPAEQTTWVHEAPNQYLTGHAMIDRDGQPVTRDFGLIGDMIAKKGWLRK